MNNLTKLFLILAIAFLVAGVSANAATVTISANTNWSAITTGSGGGGQPNNTDEIIVKNNITITVDVANATCLSVELGNNSNPNKGDGTILFNSGSQLTVSGTVTLGNGPKLGSITMTSGGTLVCNALSVVAFGTWTPGTGTVQFNAASSVPTNFTTFNNLTANTGATSLGVATTVSGILKRSGTGTFTGTAPTLGASATVEYAGSAAQTTGAELPATLAAGQTLKINNSNGVTLEANRTINGTLLFTSGNLSTSTFTLTTTGTVTPTSGHVVGNLKKNFAINGSSQTRTFEIGDATKYTPVSVTMASVSTGGSVTATTTSSEHPNLNISNIDPAKDVNRYWTLTNSGTVFSTYDATFNWVAADTEVGANHANFKAQRYNGSAWSTLTTSGPTATSITATGINAMSDFAVGEFVQTFTITASAGSNGTITPSGSVVVNSGTSKHFSIAPDANYHVDSLIVDGSPVTADTQYTFSNVTADHSIRAVFAITVYTIDASAGTNGTITPSGSVQVNSGADQHFSIAPDASYHVDSLIVDDAPVSADTQYTFNTVAANHTIRAVFAINVYTISATAGSNGTITPSGAVLVTTGNDQHFSIAPSTGYHVDSLIIDGTPIATDTQYTFSGVVADHSIHAAFAIDQFTITSSAGTNGSISPTPSTIVNYGDSTVFSLIPDAGYHADSLYIDGVGQLAPSKASHTLKLKLASSIGPTYTFHNVTANHDIHVTFAINVYTITSSAGPNGTITPSGSTGVTNGTDQHYSIAPDAHYHVDSLIVDGSPIGVDTQYTFTNVTVDHSIHVAFAIDQLTITSSAGANGTISPTPSALVNYGDSATFTLTPDDLYHVDSIFIDGVGLPGKAVPVHFSKGKVAHSGVVETYTFHNVTADHSISVTFAHNDFTINASAGTNGSITPSGSVNAKTGSNPHFTITPNTGYHVDSLYVDGTPITPDTGYSFSNVTADHSISATFAINVYTITPSSGSNGSINPSTPVNVNFGDSTTFGFFPSGGYHIDSVIVDGSLVPSKAVHRDPRMKGVNSPVPAGTYTFRNVSADHTIRVTFALTMDTIIATAGPHGTITPSGTVSVIPGNDQHFNIVPSGSYFVDSLIVDGVAETPDTQYTFTGVSANHTIRVTFAINSYIITASAGSHGSISPTGAVPVLPDSNQTFIITPDPGFVTDSILVDEVAQTVAPTYTFTAVGAGHTIRAVFISGPENVSITNGNWSNPSTWSKGTVPVNSDSVIISNGTTVTLDINGTCGGIDVMGTLSYSNNAGRVLTVSTVGGGNSTISGTVTFAAQTQQRFFVGGSLNCTGTVNNNSTGSSGSFFVFNGSGSKSIGSSAVLRGISLSGSGLSLSLTQSLTLSSGLTLSNGNLVLGSSNLLLASTANSDTGKTSSYVVADGSGKMIRIVGASASTFPIGTASGFNRVTLATGTSSDTFAVRIIGSVSPSSAKDSAAVMRTIDWSRSGTDDLGFMTMTFQWNGGEEGPLFVRPSASSWRYTGTAWAEEGTIISTVGSDPYVATLAGITSVGLYTVGNAGVLPIQLSQFTASTIQSHTVRIAWTTISEQNTYGFYVQRRTEHEIGYTTISGLIAGAGTSLEQHEYAFDDQKASGGVYYYRIETVDLNHDVEYSQPIKVNVILDVTENKPLEFALMQNYPNPFNPSTTIRYSVPTAGSVSLKIFDILGQEVATLVNAVQQPGEYSIHWNAGGFSSGMYFYKIVAGENTRILRMLLVK